MSQASGRDLHAHAHAFVGMGSNEGDRLAILRSAADALLRGFVPHTRLLAASSIYETRAIGASSAAYLNAVVLLETGLSAGALLWGLHELEFVHGRRRKHHWGGRTLDLDLLLYRPLHAKQSLRIDRLDIRVPHPELAHRDFALAPLAELEPHVHVHAGQDASTLLEALSPHRRTILARLDEPLLPDEV